MKTGTVGVTLTAATRVYLMEPVRAVQFYPAAALAPASHIFSPLPDLTHC